MQQQTIQKTTTISGIGLHSGQNITMEVQPAPANHGIIFVRTDMPHQPKIPASLSSLHHRMRCTALMANGGEVHTTEHFLATCLAMQLHNLLVNISGPEVPGMDGSALPFYQILQEAGKHIQSETAKIMVIKEAIQVQDKKASLQAIPHPTGLVLAYHLVYDLPGFPEQNVRFEINEENFAKEIAPARTFALKQEVDALLKLGLGKGANLQNTLILDDHGQIISNQLRFPDEFARHKLLDLLGDLALSGYFIQGEIQGERSGHELNAVLARAIQEKHSLDR